MDQPSEQAGFRKDYSTMDHIDKIEQIIEKYAEYKRPLYIAFIIDYKKAFNIMTIWMALEKKIRKLSQTSISKVRAELNWRLGPLSPAKSS